MQRNVHHLNAATLQCLLCPANSASSNCFKSGQELAVVTIAVLHQRRFWYRCCKREILAGEFQQRRKGEAQGDGALPTKGCANF